MANFGNIISGAVHGFMNPNSVPTPAQTLKKKKTKGIGNPVVLAAMQNALNPSGAPQTPTTTRQKTLAEIYRPKYAYGR